MSDAVYREAAIRVMSGTGNSYRVATWLAQEAHEAGAAADVALIGPGRAEGAGSGGQDRLLGVVFPTHGFTAPWPVLRFVCRLPRGSGTHAVVVPTRAGTKIGPLFLPGLEGTGGYLVALLLALKGYGVRGVMAVDMPSNFLIAHPGFSEPSARAIVARAEPKCRRFASTILAGRRCFGGTIPLLLGLLLLPVSLAYALLGRFVLAKMMFASTRCTGCGQCARACPFGAIRMQSGEPARPYWTFSCENCLRCMAWCPEQAVESGHSLGLLLCLVASIPVSVYALDWIAARVPLPAVLNSVGVRLLLQYPFTLFVLWLTYLLFSAAIRIPAVNKLFTYTTLVHWFRRYHEPDTSLDDLTAGGDDALEP